MAGYKKNKRGEKKTWQWPACQRRPWTGDMIMTTAGGVGRVSYESKSYLAECLHWVSSHDPKVVREPQPTSKRFRVGEGFTAAGKDYTRLAELREKQVPENAHWYEDIYGREVFFLSERKYFAMDVYDTMYDDRYLRWYFIREGEKLTRIYHDTESSFIHVTEDVRELEYDCWRVMKKEHYFG